MRYVILPGKIRFLLTELTVLLYFLIQNASPIDHAHGKMATLTKGTVEDARRPESSPRPKGRGKSRNLLYSK